MIPAPAIDRSDIRRMLDGWEKTVRRSGRADDRGGMRKVGQREAPDTRVYARREAGHAHPRLSDIWSIRALGGRPVRPGRSRRRRAPSCGGLSRRAGLPRAQENQRRYRGDEIAASFAAAPERREVIMTDRALAQGSIAPEASASARRPVIAIWTGRPRLPRASGGRPEGGVNLEEGGCPWPRGGGTSSRGSLRASIAILRYRRDPGPRGCRARRVGRRFASGVSVVTPESARIRQSSSAIRVSAGRAVNLPREGGAGAFPRRSGCHACEQRHAQFPTPNAG